MKTSNFKFQIKYTILVFFILNTLYLIHTTAPAASAQSATSAAALLRVSDTISTSRPSASSLLSTNQTTGEAFTIIHDNGSLFFASDSASLLDSSGVGTESAIINSVSKNTPSAGLQTLYFSTPTTSSHQAGNPVIVGVTTLHTITLTPQTIIPIGGRIVLTFPGIGSNSASPSASTFAFNGLNGDAGTKIKVYFASGSSTCTISTAAPKITCTIAGAQVAPNTAITFLIGCTANTLGACTTPAPTLINPTKSSAFDADIWTIRARTYTSGGILLDDGKAKIATTNQVQVQAQVATTLIFTIEAIGNDVPVNTGNSYGCLHTETTNAGSPSASTQVQLGRLNTTPTTIDTKVGNISAQLLVITTNAQNGYVLTATSSGQLVNTASSVAIPSSASPTAFQNGAAWFGIHPCGSDVPVASWTTNSTQSCNTNTQGSSGNLCKYAWPQTGSIQLASDSTGPIGESSASGSGMITVEYAAGIDSSIPGGNYQTQITYTVTPSF